MYDGCCFNTVLHLSLSQVCLHQEHSPQYLHQAPYPLECLLGCPCPLAPALLPLREALQYPLLDLHRSLRQACTHQVRTEHFTCSQDINMMG